MSAVIKTLPKIVAPSLPPAKSGKNGDGAVTRTQINISVSLWLELAARPEKNAPAWAYIPPSKIPNTQRIVAVLNTEQWPAAAALQRRDWRAIKWLASLGIMDRLYVQLEAPVLRAIHHHLCRLAFGRNWQRYESSGWAAYALKDTSLLSGIEKLTIFEQGTGIASFGEFNTTVG